MLALRGEKSMENPTTAVSRCLSQAEKAEYASWAGTSLRASLFCSTSRVWLCGGSPARLGEGVGEDIGEEIGEDASNFSRSHDHCSFRRS